MSFSLPDDMCQRTYAAANIYFYTGEGESISAAGALKQAGYSASESKNRTLQRQLNRLVRRWKEELKDSRQLLPPPPEFIHAISDQKALSDVTNTCSSTTKNPEECLDTPSPLEKRKLAKSMSSSTKPSVKRTRRTVKQKQAEEARKQAEKEIESKAFFSAAKEWREELMKPKDKRKSARLIVTHYNKVYGTTISERTLRRKVRLNDDTAPRSGRKSRLLPEMEATLCRALTSYIKLSCCRMECQPNRKDLIQRLQISLERTPFSVKRYDALYDRLLANISLQVETVSDNTKMEARRVQWSTYTNINCWFDSLKTFLIEHGFATATDDNTVEGELLFGKDQLHRILNIDKSEVSTDGTTKIRGGRPVTEYQPRGTSIHSGTTRTNKSGYSITFIGGSTVSGYPIPAHFQLKSEAKEENKKISLDYLENVPSVHGYYGFGKLTKRGVTFNLNAKGGMDTVEFEKYLKHSIVPLFPDAEDTPGKRVAIIVDSGPGRINESLLAFLKVRGFFIILGVPNTTHITQATDKNYGLFKTVYRENLAALTRKRATAKKGIRPADIPLLVFGGNDDKLKLRSAFDEAFAVSKSIAVWKRIGINPFTCACLGDRNVVHELILQPDGTIDLTKDPTQQEIIEIEKMNKKAILELTRFGLNGTPFSETAPTNKGRKAIAITERNTKERQDAIAAAKTAGDRFIATGGDPLNTEDYFIAMERERVRNRIGELKATKTAWEYSKKIEEAAINVIEKCEASSGKDAYTEEGAKTLKKDDLAILYEWKKGKKPQQMNKGRLLTEWMESKDSERVNNHRWEEDDCKELERLETDEIEIKRTALGKERSILLTQSLAALDKMSKEEVNAHLAGVDKEKLRRILDE